ncbi:exodeoxyribonuclease V subunit beta [Reinekea marina]|uniref:RecBCD enzyme subunit RecB n=1 Tax=Reinekea marina TaxID=1310421 RepID=A0ABV7WSZ6_9GAMM|nr:exodeoxyribonuclease V subunit beta [Reinekea marina]MDN3648195.1 exodeoxyribonuclease V subunit beta [Reinekea marina]
MQTLDSTCIPLQGSHLIEASAGTGKTHNILRIYLRLLIEKDLNVDQILVMTFTKAATAELRNRLNHFLRLTHSTWTTSDDKDIRALSAKVSEHQAKLKLETAILQLDEAAIYTIHGFCKRALTQHAFFSGISFNANMEADSSELTIAATQDFYREFQADTRFETLYEQWPTPESFIKYWQNAINATDQIPKPNRVELKPLLDAFKKAWPEEQQAFETLNITKSTAKAETKTQNLEDFTQLNAIAEQALDPAQAHFAKDTFLRCFKAKKKLAALPHSLALVTALQTNEKVEQLLIALSGVDYIKDHINKNKVRLDQLDFNDLIIQLKQGLLGENGEALSLALKEQFPAALIDEFQDTDPDQYTLLQQIYKNSPDAFICMIGDPKQAIYGFRGGDVFAYLQAGKQVDHRWTMNTNYRSSPSVIAGCNQIFLSDIPEMPDQTFGFGIEYREVRAPEGKALPEASDSASRSPVQWVNIEPSNNKSVPKDFQKVIADWCVNEIVNLIQGTHIANKNVLPGDIALLVRGYSEAELLQQKLQAAGLTSVYLSARTNVLHTAESTALFHLLSGIWQFENDRLFIRALASHWIALSTKELDNIQHNEHQWALWQLKFEQWREDWQHRGLMSMLLSILQSHFKASNSNTDRQLTNMIHLAELLQKESSQYKTPDALLHWFKQARDQESAAFEQQLRLESDDNLIKIVTMHGSKGLEYPIVFIPFASYFGKRNTPPALSRLHDRNSLKTILTANPSDNEKVLAQEEEQAEQIRLFYVAATRAINRLYICTAPFKSFTDSPIAHTLRCAEFNPEEIKQKACLEPHSSMLTIRESEIETANINEIDQPPIVTASEFFGRIERDWWLSSFSALTRHVNHSGHSTPDRDDLEKIETRPEDLPLRFRLTKGAEAGNLLHDAFEHADFVNPNIEALYIQAKERYSSLADTFSQDEFERWFREMLQTPLTQGGSLAELPKNKTLRESEFYFPMHGAPVQQLANIVSACRGYPVTLPDRHKLKGMMHGFIDLIFEHQGKFYVADYKSTHLGDALTDYSHDAMKENVQNAFYDVQYLLYSLALHRYLALRLPNYNFEQHFGGVYYLYLRGMSPQGNTGVYFDPLSFATLKQLDDVFEQKNHEGAAS